MRLGELVLFAVLSAASSGPTCDEWMHFSPGSREKVIRSLLDKSLPNDLPLETVACVRSMAKSIADETAAICKQDGGKFPPAASKAIGIAIDFCRSKQ